MEEGTAGNLGIVKDDVTGEGRESVGTPEIFDGSEEEIVL